MSRNKRSETDGRDRFGRFTKGAPGGPGRPAGTGEHRAAVLRACGPQQVEEIIAAMVERAREGDPTAARIVLDRVLGRAAEQQSDLRLQLPALDDAEQVAEGVRLVVRAVAAGQLPVADGRAVVDLLSAALEAGELRQLLQQREGDRWSAA